MKKLLQRIEVVSSTVTGLSSMSQESRAAILAVLSKHYAQVQITIVNNYSDLEALVDRKPDLVFLGMKFIFFNQDKVWLSYFLDTHGIAHTGSNYLAHQLEFDKPLAKQRVADMGLKTSGYHVVYKGHEPNKAAIELPFPLFVKPTSLGGGAGINSDSVVNNFDELKSKVRLISADLQSDSLIETYLSGREFSVAILKDEFSDQYSAMPIELVAPLSLEGSRILSAEVKSSNKEKVIKVKEQSLKDQVCKLAMNVFHSLGGRDYGRIDIRLDQFGVPHFLEANLIPSLIDGYGSFPKACALNIGLGYEEMILSITTLGMQRSVAELDEPIGLSPVPIPA